MLKKFGFGLWRIVNKFFWINIFICFYNDSMASSTGLIDSIKLNDLKNNRLILNQSSDFIFPIESILISKDKIFIKTYGSEYYPVKLEKIDNNSYRINNLVFLYSGDGIILPESIDKKILEIYSKGIFRLEFIFNKNKGNHIDYAIVYGESNIENKKYYFEEKFIPSDKIK